MFHPRRTSFVLVQRRRPSQRPALLWASYQYIWSTLAGNGQSVRSGYTISRASQVSSSVRHCQNTIRSCSRRRTRCVTRSPKSRPTENPLIMSRIAWQSLLFCSNLSSIHGGSYAPRSFFSSIRLTCSRQSSLRYSHNPMSISFLFRYLLTFSSSRFL